MHHLQIISTAAAVAFASASAAQTRNPHRARQEPVTSLPTSSPHSASAVPTATLPSAAPTAGIGDTIHPTTLCASERSKVADTEPTVPAEILSFSSSYYDTHPRTASEAAADCAWIEHIPDELDAATFEYWNETFSWTDRFDPVQDWEVRRDIFDYLQCMRDNAQDIPCLSDFDEYTEDVVVEWATRLAEDFLDELREEEGRASHPAAGGAVPVILAVIAGSVLLL